MVSEGLQSGGNQAAHPQKQTVDCDPTEHNQIAAQPVINQWRTGTVCRYNNNVSGKHNYNKKFHHNPFY